MWVLYLVQVSVITFSSILEDELVWLLDLRSIYLVCTQDIYFITATY
jgi:hypothetical protein